MDERILDHLKRLVHVYWELETETIHKIIQENVEDFKLFQEKIVIKLKNN
jgi:uncharacterized protein YutE (UPF0331/DUF86 family)